MSHLFSFVGSVVYGMADSSHLSTSEVGNVTVVTFTDRSLLDSERIEQWGADLLALVDVEHRTRLLLDFQGVEYLSSAALNKLLLLDKRIKNQGGVIKLCGLKPEIAKVFELTCLDALFDIRSGHDDALAAF